MRPLGGGRVAQSLRLGLFNEPKSAYSIPHFYAAQVQFNLSFKLQYFCWIYTVDLVSVFCDVPPSLRSNGILRKTIRCPRSIC